MSDEMPTCRIDNIFLGKAIHYWEHHEPAAIGKTAAISELSRPSVCQLIVKSRHEFSSL